MIGKILRDIYEIVFPLGSGGFGQVYLSRKIDLIESDKWVVVKQLNPIISPLESTSFEEAKERFEKEAEILGELGKHPKIPELVDYFEENEQFYIVQEFIDGHELIYELETYNFCEDQVYELLIELLEILDFIQSKGIVHRDIAPDNVLRRRINEDLVLIDFGAIKKAVFDVENKLRFSRTKIIGKEDYMPDEQANGRPLFCSDIYALGVISIQCMIGILPTKDYNSGELEWQHYAGNNCQLTEILKKMTKCFFRERYQSAKEVLDDLYSVNFIKRNPSFKKHQYDYAKLWYERANKFRNLGFHKQAALLYRRAIECNHKHYKSWFNIGITYVYLHDYQSAIESLSIRNNSTESRFHMGICFYKQKQYEQAIDMFDEIIHSNQCHALAWFNRGLCLYEINKYEQTIMSYQNAVGLRPSILAIIPSEHRDLLL